MILGWSYPSLLFDIAFFITTWIALTTYTSMPHICQSLWPLIFTTTTLRSAHKQITKQSRHHIIPARATNRAIRYLVSSFRKICWVFWTFWLMALFFRVACTTPSAAVTRLFPPPLKLRRAAIAMSILFGMTLAAKSKCFSGVVLDVGAKSTNFFVVPSMVLQP